MKIAVSAEGPALEAEVDPRFGRCRYLILLDPETMEFEAVDNSRSRESGGAGVSAAQIAANKGAKAVLTGNCGPNAYEALSAAGIEVVTGVTGKVKEVAQSYKLGKLRPSTKPSVGEHFGLRHGADA